MMMLRQILTVIMLVASTFVVRSQTVDGRYGQAELVETTGDV